MATITTRCLDEGTRSHAGEEFAELLETEGAGFGVEIGLSGLQAVLDVPVRRLDRAFELFAEAVTEPALADDDIDRHVQLRLAEIEQGRANSASRASTEFRRATYAGDSRASRMNGGEPETVAAVTADDAAAFHATGYGPTGTSLVVAGDLTGIDVVALAERSFGGWHNERQQQFQLPAGRTGSPYHASWWTVRARCRPTCGSVGSRSTGPIPAGRT